jgi:CHAT domain-containing protein
MFHRILLLPLVSVFCLAQVPLAGSDEAKLVAGRKLVAELKLDQQADAAMFRAIGLDLAGKLMTAVQSRDMPLTATVVEQAELHRATAGMIELSIERGNYFLAGLYATIQAANYEVEDDYKQALTASRLALEFQQKSGMTETLDIPWVQVGRDLMKLREPRQALGSFQQAWRLMSDPNVKRSGWTRRDIVQAEIAVGDLTAAHQESARFLNDSKNGRPEYRAAALLAFTDVSIGEHNFDSVLDTLKQVWATGAGQLEALSQLFDCNLLAMRSLDYDQAIALSKRIDLEFSGISPAGSALARSTNEYRRRMAGDIDGLLRDEATRLASARSANNLGAQIEVLGMMAASYRAANNIDNQIAALEEALELQKSLFTAKGSPANSEKAVAYLQTLNTLGEAHLKLHHIDKARHSFNEAIQASQRLMQAKLVNQPAGVYAEALVGRAKIQAQDDESDEARTILENALKGLPHAASFNRKDVLWQLARLERDEHRNSQSAGYYDQAIRWIHGSGRYSSPADEAFCRVEFAHFLITGGRALPDSLALAGTQLDAAQSLVAGQRYSEIQWRIFYQRGLLAEAKGNKAGALEIYRGGMAQLEAVRSGLDTEQRQSLVDKELIQDLYLRALTLSADSQTDAALWEMLERGKARSFVDALAGRRFRSGDVAEPARAAVDGLENQIASLRVGSLPENAALRHNSARVMEAKPGELDELEAKLQLARQVATLSKSRAGSSVSTRPVPLDRIRELLPVRTALLEFGLIENGVVALIVTREGSRQIRLNMDVRELDRDVHELSRWIGQFGGGDRLATALRTVSERIQPALSAVPKDSDRLILVPAGFLHYVPFQALYMGDGRAMIDRFTISYLPSGSVLEFLPGKAKPSSDLFLGAIGNLSVEGNVPLPGTLQETDAIAALYPNAILATEAGFTHDQVRTALLTHEVVHLATHGIYDERAPMFSALLTAGAAGKQTRLAVYEFPEMNIRARTVILSACETGKGKLSGGDEISGLTQSILLAGADTVVSSLWQVSDSSTVLLMQGFHRRLLAGESPAQALRESALDVRKQYPEPFYWAPFVVTGAI